MGKMDIFMAIWNILRKLGIFYDHLVHFVFIWYILCSFGTFFRFWYRGPIKIWQPWRLLSIPPNGRITSTRLPNYITCTYI
jgi:hypothetical protein